MGPRRERGGISGPALPPWVRAQGPPQSREGLGVEEAPDPRDGILSRQQASHLGGTLASLMASPPGPHPIHRSPTAGGTFNSATQIRSPPAESPHGSHCTRDGAKLLTQAGGLHRACPHPSLLSPLLLTPKPLASQLFLPRPRTPLCLSEYSSAWQVSPPPSVSTMASPRRPS